MKHRRLSRENWLDLGLSQLSEHGPDGLKLEPMCSAAGLTRGSFYHHFDDHDAFVQAVTERWVETGTDRIVQALDTEANLPDVEAQLHDLATSLDYRLELGIRELARRAPQIRDTVRKADGRRLNVLTGLYSAKFGIKDNDARFAAFIEYAAFVGTILIAPDMEQSAQDALADRFQDVLGSYFKAA